MQQINAFCPCHAFWNCSSIFSRLFKKSKFKKQKKPVLKMVDDILNPQVTNYSRLQEHQCLPTSVSCTSHDIPLQSLDARALLARTTESTPGSSLDLEWEHETLPISVVSDTPGRSWITVAEEYDEHHYHESSPQLSAPPHESDSEWSRISSANSLEWDSIQNSLHASPPVSDIDTDTQMLLCEIERLTSQTLSETGLDLDSAF